MAIMRAKEEMTNPGIPTGGKLDTILGQDASFDGTLTFKGQVRIDGRFSGKVETDDTLSVGKDATVTADLNVGSLVLHGTLKGNVKAQKSVELHPPARLYGDISTPNLTIHSGVVFEGSCRMENLDAPKATILKAAPPIDGKKDAPKEEKK